MKMRRLMGLVLALVLVCTAAGCGLNLDPDPIPEPEPKSEIVEKMDIEVRPSEELPEKTVALKLTNVGCGDNGYYMDCLAYDEDANLLAEVYFRLPLAEAVEVSYYPMEVCGSGGEHITGAQETYTQFQSWEKDLHGVMFWDYTFDEDGALCYLTDEVPRELIVEKHPVEDFFGCWDYSDCFYDPGLWMYNVPSEPPCGDYIVLNDDWTAEVYRMEENTVYYAGWTMWDDSAYIGAMEILLSFTGAGLEDSNGHHAQQGTPPSSDGMEWVDLT